MKSLLSLLCALFSLTALIAREVPIRTGIGGLTDYHVPQEGVPKGRLEGPFEFRSKIIEGTVRRYWIFVPAQYDGSEAAGVLVFHDGQRATHPEGVLRVHQVMENAIARGEMPVSIGIFITPGNLSERYPDDLGWSNPNHRAPEYDAMDDRYARFLIEEMLPEVGKSYRLTDDPEKRCIGGTSSGAICAFTVAWHRPDAFRKVLSFIGSYVSIGFRPDETPPRLGGQDYPALIRREPIRPLRVYLQDGNRDLDNRWGNWFLANQQMLAAFDFANAQADRAGSAGPRYAVEAVWTDGVHNDDHAGALLPEALRWVYAQDAAD
ncbi:alpha/beta hydrolase-fold protein [Pelagicoccus sp. SDUM812005]|uniref:alpha/beta hydrolase n=1 Tax=Pelagicoccus sp. SDUM812005 TaxID=3041257 RepID=UPI00280FC3B7|nr:alpha/beta hydrolase-fold protein [Pelagicoccus sp. SDUM812005]MDQ8179109.1 alpha/beta hydrolase-fold protein [Pelagicoccus sp. SDUM812005]